MTDTSERIRQTEVHPEADDERHAISTMATRKERAALLSALLEACPELRRHDSRIEAEATATVLVGFMGRMTYGEIGEVVGVSRQRAEQLALLAMKKMRLAGGRDLRESWEHAAARDRVTWADACSLVDWGFDD